MRALKAEHHLIANKDLTLCVAVKTEARAIFERHRALVQQLVGFKSIEMCEVDALSALPRTVSNWGHFAILTHKNEAEAQKERQQVQEEIKQLSKHIASAQQKLSNKSFIEHAPAPVVKGVEDLLKANLAKLEDLQKVLNA